MPDRGAAAILAALRDGDLELIGRLVGSSNNAMVVRVRPGVPDSGADRGDAFVPEAERDAAAQGERDAGAQGERDAAAQGEADAAAQGEADAAALERSLMDPAILHAVYKPTAGERPLFDFPLGTLTRREVAAFLVSEATGWGIVPPTLLRDGPFGEGMVQQWIVRDESADVVEMIQSDDARLRRHAIFDAIVNNTDRKGGHLLPVPGGHVYGVDHGVTFSVVPKLRTILWAWEGERIERDELEGIERVRDALRADLGDALLELLKRGEVLATRRRTEALLRTRVFPGPNPDWPAVPWPPF